MTARNRFQDTIVSNEPVHIKKKVAGTDKRNVTVDLARLFAAYGVIALHVPYSTPAAQSFNILFWPLCVPFFYVVSITYFVSGLHQASVRNILMRTWRRIVLPYLAWSTIYVGLLVAKRLMMGQEPGIVLWRVLLHGESAVHLYFLPTLLMLQSMALAIFLIFNSYSKKRGVGVALLAATLGYFIWGDLNNCFGVAATGQLIGLIVYIAVAFLLSPKIQALTIRPMYAVIGIVLIVTVVFLNWLGYRLDVLDYSLILPIGGVGLLLLTIGIPRTTLPKWLSNLVSASFGIYLSHVLFLEAFEFFAKISLHVSIDYNFSVKALEVTTIFLLSAMLTFVLRKILIGRQILLGE